MEILIINICKHKLHFDEFIRPIYDICKQITTNIKIINYLELKEESIDKYNKIIISGTALKDFDYLENLDKFSWIKTTKKSILGICAGAQIIAKIFSSEIVKEEEIGMQKLEIVKIDKILKNIKIDQIYSLHNCYFNIPKDFILIAKTKHPQIIKKENIYGCLFHPEARNKELILNFLNL